MLFRYLMASPDEHRRLGQIWSRLLVFRAVAESEHLPSAARSLNVSVSAVSRSLSLLEARLGRRLFIREMRKLTLNDAGRNLLLAVRRAEDAAVRGISVPVIADQPQGLRFGAMGQLARTHLFPGLALTSGSRFPHSVRIGANRTAMLHAVADHELDVLLAYNCPPNVGLSVTALPESAIGIYVGRGHRAFERASVENLLREAFVVPSTAPDRVWPDAIPRRVGIVSDDAALSYDLCLSGRFVMAMSESSARSKVACDELRGGLVPGVRSPSISVVTRLDRASRALASSLTEAMVEGARA
jgi:DNA-binding transcriptional LysR family regulator